MSKYNYFYFLTTPNNKLYYFVELLYRYAGEKIVVLVKNNEQIKELCSFLKGKSIYSECFALDDVRFGGQIILENLFFNTNIFIMTEIQLSKISQKTKEVCNIINLYCSLDKDKILEKYDIFEDSEQGKLIELISKVDFELVQELYKNKEFVVNKYAVSDAGKRRESMQFFMNDFIKKYKQDKCVLRNQESYAEEGLFLNEIGIDEQVQFLKDFYLWVNMHACIPTLNITDGGKKYKKVYIQINHGFADNLTKKLVSVYLQSCPGVEAVEIRKMEENKILLCAKGYSLKVNCLTEFIDTNPCNNKTLGYVVVSEEVVNQECIVEKTSDLHSQSPKREYRSNNQNNDGFFGGGRQRQHSKSYDKNKPQYNKNNSRFGDNYKSMRNKRDDRFGEFDNRKRFDRNKSFDVNDYNALEKNSYDNAIANSDRYSDNRSNKNGYFQKNQYGGRYNNLERNKFRNRINKKDDYRSFNKNKNVYNKDIDYENGD